MSTKIVYKESIVSGDSAAHAKFTMESHMNLHWPQNLHQYSETFSYLG